MFLRRHYVLIIYLLFHLTSGGQNLLWKLNSEKNGNQQLIDSIYSPKSKPNFKQLIIQKDSVLKVIRRLGYFELLEQPLTQINDSTFASKISLGRKYTHIQLLSNTLDLRINEGSEALHSQKGNNIIIAATELSTQLKELKDYFNNKGYSMATIKPKEFIFNNTDTVNLNLEIVTHKLRTIDRIEIKGYSNFPKSYLERILKRGVVASEKNILDINKQLNQLKFIKTIKEPELLFKKDSTVMYTYLEKANTNSVDGMIGFNSNPEGKIELNGYLDLVLQNNLNKGESLQIIYRGDNKDQTRLNIDFKIPYILNSKIGLQSNLQFIRRDSTYQNTIFKVGTFYSPNFNKELGISYTSTSSSTGTFENNSSSNYTFNGAAISFQYAKESKDKLQGAHLALTTNVQIGSRISMLSKDNQWKFFLNGIKRFRFTERQHLVAIARLQYLNTENTLFNELFQIGGMNSIRGFNQNAIDTKFFTSFNTEYRFELTPTIYIHTIFDFGYFENFNSKKLENIYSFGLGTGILTNAGLLKLSIANGVFTNANIDFSSTIAHINLTIRF